METPISELLPNIQFLSTDEVHSLWYDWFCKNASLDKKGRVLLRRLLRICRRTRKFDLDKTYVFFKNNCPLYGDGRLYDDFRICDIETGDVIFTITPRNPYGKSTIYGKENKFQEPIVEGTWKEVVNYFQD